MLRLSFPPLSRRRRRGKQEARAGGKGSGAVCKTEFQPMHASFVYYPCSSFPSPPLQTAVHVALQIDCRDIFFSASVVQCATWRTLASEPWKVTLQPEHYKSGGKCSSDILTCRPRKDYAGFPLSMQLPFCITVAKMCTRAESYGRIPWGREGEESCCGGGRMAVKCLPSPRRKAPSLQVSLHLSPSSCGFFLLQVPSRSVKFREDVFPLSMRLFRSQSSTSSIL